jgi:hypothetical protein
MVKRHVPARHGSLSLTTTRSRLCLTSVSSKPRQTTVASLRSALVTRQATPATRANRAPNRASVTSRPLPVCRALVIGSLLLVRDLALSVICAFCTLEPSALWVYLTRPGLHCMCVQTAFAGLDIDIRTPNWTFACFKGTQSRADLGVCEGKPLCTPQRQAAGEVCYRDLNEELARPYKVFGTCELHTLPAGP